MDLASGYYASEQYLSAEKSLNRVKKLIDQSFAGKNHPLYLTVLNNLAATHLIQNNPEQALPIYKEVLQISQATQQNNRPEYAVILNNLAGAYHVKGDPNSAVLLYKEALKIKASTLGKEHPDYIKTLNEIAFFYLKNKQKKACWTYLKKAIEAIAPLEAPLAFDTAWSIKILKQSGPSNLHLQQLIRTLEGAFNLLQQTNKVKKTTAKQQIIAHVAIQLLQKVQNRTTTDKDKLRLLTNQNEWIKKHLQLLQYPHKIDEAFTLAEQNKSTLLLTSMRAHQLQKKGTLPDSIYLEQQQLLHKTKEFEALLLKAPSVSTRSLLNLHYQEVTELNKKIERIAPLYTLQKSQAVLQNLPQIQQKLDKETALIEYVISDSCLHIFLCTQREKIWRKVPLSKGLLNAKIYALRKNLSDYRYLKFQPKQAKESFIRNAHWAYTQLLAPVLAEQSGLKNLIIIPDGALGTLPFECFLTQADSGKTAYKKLPYLVKSYTVSYNYSANLWAEIRSKKTNSNNGKILAMAPNYGSVDWPQEQQYRLKSDIIERKKLLPLQAIEQEVATLEKQFKGKFLYGMMLQNVM